MLARTRGVLPSLGWIMMPTPSLLAEPSRPIPIILTFGFGWRSIFDIKCLELEDNVVVMRGSFLSAALSIGSQFRCRVYPTVYNLALLVKINWSYCDNSTAHSTLPPSPSCPFWQISHLLIHFSSLARADHLLSFQIRR